jgi:hypothetical protein
MGLRDLFIVSDEKPKDKPAKVTQTKTEVNQTKFPTDDTEKNDNPFNEFTSNFGFGGKPESKPVNVSNEHLANAIDLYERGFDSLNQPGYDFYEYFKAVLAGGVDNSQIFTMAFSMANAMDKNVTKESLLSQSDFYTSEITKVYSDFVSKGNAKLSDVNNQRIAENESLVGELKLMNEQLEMLTTQINDRKQKLSVIEVKYGTMVNDVETKIAANDIAKEKLLGSINKVKEGIKNNLK